MNYKITYQENGQIKTIKTKSLDDEILPKNIISIKKNSFNLSFDLKKRVTDKQIKNILYELSLMLDSKILLDEAFMILIKKEKNDKLKEFIKILQNSFSKSSNISKNLKEFKINFLVKSFFKVTQEMGNPLKNIKSLYNIVSYNYDIKKEFLKSMIYPCILLFTFFMSLIGIFKFVVPNFQSILLQSKVPLSFATKTLFFTKEVFDNYLFFIICGFFLIFLIFIYMYKQNAIFKIFLDKVLAENLFLISSLYKLRNLYFFFICLRILLESNYEFLLAISKAKILLNNKYLFDKITKIENLIKSGKSISFAFESINYFDELTLSLLKTAEVSNSMESIFVEIEKIYKIRFDDRLKLFSLLIEPLFLMLIMSLIIWIILAVFVPLWSMNDILGI